MKNITPVSEKNSKTNIDFYGKRKIFYGISIGLLLICLIVNFIVGTKLDIQFTGGTVLKYSYSGTVLESDMTKVIQDATKQTINCQYSESLSATDSVNNKIVSIEFTDVDTITPDEQKTITDALAKAYPDNNIEVSESSSVSANMGKSFLLKCLAAVLLAGVLMLVYVAVRFRKIGGWSAGAMALVGLLHDVLFVYFSFVIFGMPLDDNFIAVVLVIIGYSLNATIIIYDRIRENRRIMGYKASLSDIVNKSINQCLGRTINTTISTLIAVLSVLVVAIVFGLDSVISFALPMVVGVIVGCYQSNCIAVSLWTTLQIKKKKKLAEKSKDKKNNNSAQK